MPSPAPTSRRLHALAAVLALCACGGPQPAATPATTHQPETQQPQTQPATTQPSETRTTETQPERTPTPTPSNEAITIPQRSSDDELLLAFAGDANAFQGAARSVELGLGGAGDLLEAADWSMVNLESALADDPSGLAKQPKLYTFLTGSSLPRMLHREGVDVASLANNHAMDYGVAGMERTLAIKQSSELAMIGVGKNEQEAFAPWVGQVRGRDVVALAGNDILESNMDWRPRDGRPGVAMVKTEAGFTALLEAVEQQRAARPQAVVVVFMHWGIDYQICTSGRQETMARELAEAGASIVVGTHAHRVQRATTIGDTVVAYGLGNFNFYSDRTATRETGVLSVRVPAAGAPAAQWFPGRIVDGGPVLLTGQQAADAVERWQSLPGGC